MIYLSMIINAAFKIINRYIHFVDKDDQKHVPIGNSMKNGHGLLIIMTIKANHKSRASLPRTLNQLSHQVAPTTGIAITLDEINRRRLQLLDHAETDEPTQADFKATVGKKEQGRK